jgi:two-component system LytT family response regulator
MRDLLAGHPDTEVAGECADGPEAVEAIEKSRPELVFLDVQMPGMDGFAVVDAVGIDRMPPVVLMSACEQHAVRAFEVCALDYLLKPFDRERFEKVLDRARAQIGFGSFGAWNRRLLSLLGRVRPAGSSSDRLVIRSGGRLFLLPCEEVDWIGAEGNYARIHAGKQAHLVRETLADLERRLDGCRFLRIHKSTIVNADRIREIQPTVNGAHVVLLRDGSRLTWSRGYRSRLKDLIGEDD